ncbi:MAG: DNA repair protein RecN [Bacteroidales bacterium]|nr:DNA repair protein RecN [Bacteroidales bacterium]
MLRSLQIRNYVLIDSLEIDFPEGLVIITGQTGAGKSILVGALGLVLGAKADASLVGAHGDTCVVEAEFSADEDVRAILAANDLEDSDILTIRRVVNRSGRSRSFVGDEPVSLPVLQELSERLIDIHSQHQTLRLGNPAFRMEMLDHFAGNKARLAACREAWTALQDVRKSLSDITARLERLSAEKDYNEAVFNKLDEARLREGELEELEAEQKQLAHAEEVKELLSAGEEAFSPSCEEAPLTARLKEAEKSVSRAVRYIPSLEPLVKRLESARLELEDIAEELEDAEARIDISPQRLEQVEDRMSLLYGLMKKHGVQSEAELIAVRDELSQALFDSTALEERKADLEKAVVEAEKAYGKAAEALHAAREKAAPGFAAAILDSLRFLELDRAVFSVGLAPSADGPTGRDAVRFLFSSTGKQPQDLSKVASGGELSRIMLSLKAMMARYTSMPTLLFDEIDTGVSGSAADRMGSMICTMGEDMQVFAITHLPQVAAKGQAHYLVTKEADVTAIRRLSPEERIREIARLLSGSVITEAAVANARALLS